MIQAARLLALFLLTTSLLLPSSKSVATEAIKTNKAQAAKRANQSKPRKLKKWKKRIEKWKKKSGEGAPVLTIFAILTTAAWTLWLIGILLASSFGGAIAGWTWIIFALLTLFMIIQWALVFK